MSDQWADDNIRYLHNHPVPVPEPKQIRPSWKFYLAEILLIGGIGLGMMIGLVVGYGIKDSTPGFWLIMIDSFVAGMIAVTLWKFKMTKLVRAIVNGS